MLSLFGRRRTAPSVPDSISRLHDTIELLQKREGFLQKKIAQQYQDTWKYIDAKNKRAALMCLKRKKMYQQQSEKILQCMMNIENQVFSLESASVNPQVLHAMRGMSSSLRTMHENDTMEDIQDQMNMSEEISNTLNLPLHNILDEDDLLAELEELEQEVILSHVSPVIIRDEKPVITPSPENDYRRRQYNEAEDAELAALEASMA